jgi:hypothetical protein
MPKSRTAHLLMSQTSLLPGLRLTVSSHHVVRWANRQKTLLAFNPLKSLLEAKTSYGRKSKKERLRTLGPQSVPDCSF